MKRFKKKACSDGMKCFVHSLFSGARGITVVGAPIAKAWSDYLRLKFLFLPAPKQIGMLGYGQGSKHSFSY